jgi:hypothetical protein
MMGGRGSPAAVGGDQTVRVAGPDGYWVSDDPSHIDLPRVHAWISGESYWAAGRSYEVMARSIEHSLALGLYAADGAQAGFARLVTDRATFAWLCEVFARRRPPRPRPGNIPSQGGHQPSRRGRHPPGADG